MDCNPIHAGSNPAAESIRERLRVVELARRQVMQQFEEEHRVELQAIRKDCGAIGHIFRFSHLGPLGHPWSYCRRCNASKVDLEE